MNIKNISSTRIISGLIGSGLLITVVTLGGIVLDIAILLVSMIGVYEFSNAAKEMNNIKTISIVNYLLAIAFFTLNIFDSYDNIQLVFFLYTIILLCFLVFNIKTTPQDIAMTFFGGLYVPFLLFHISLLNNGSILIWLVFITAFATDTFAYFVGVLFGKRKLAPKLSPKKSIEGSVGGILGALIITILFAYIFNIESILKLSILSIIASIMAQVGDLTASRIKRVVGIKDYGNLMPGHGGVLDRFDSILFTAPIVYYYIHYFL